MNNKTCWYCRADEEKEQTPATNLQKDYIESLMNDYITTEIDKKYVNNFITMIKKGSLDALYKEEASQLITELRRLPVPVEMPCEDRSEVAKEELNRFKYFSNPKRCYYYCPNEIYDSQECETFPQNDN
ncbi:MAG: hypothetical protein QCH31_07165 [Methanolobus sp.]|nr:hypothetical protein [Methanolobus sp.]